MTNEERFKENLERWAPLNKEAAEKLKSLDCKSVFLCQNEDGELNLKKVSGDFIQYFHSTTSPLREAQQWFLGLNLKNISVLYVYGIGLGYYYDIVQEWLKEDPRHHVVFMEDNLEVIKYFLETERATEFLKNKQARLFHFLWESSYFSFQFVTSLFSLIPFKVSALQFYEVNEPKHMTEFHARIDFFHDVRLGTGAEFLNLGPGGFIPNYYKNLLELPHSKLELKMIGHFKDVPAIICGAGPSLAKNIHILKNLQDKALIMAGGTAMNVLNGAGIMPHFGLGIDPNPAHFNRLISNIAFEEPFFYRQRMYHRALQMIHGERILVTGASGYRLPAWFQEKLEIPKTNEIAEGHNVVNFNLSIAKELGCNPILIVGVDLAYSNNLSYAPGLVRHALQDPKDAFLTKYSHEELLVKHDINGAPVNTLWKWINESLWFAQFASSNPQITLLNCTEGGIGFVRVPNVKLADAAEKYLTQSYDFSSLIHGEVQNSSLPEGLTLPKVLDNIEIITTSMLHCESYCGSLIFEFGKLLQKLQEEESLPEIYKTPLIEEHLAKLEAEDGYKFLLQDYKERFLELLYPKHHFLETDRNFYTEKEAWIKRTIFDISLYTFLSKVARYNVNVIGASVKDVLQEKPKKPAQPSKKNDALKEKFLAEREKAQKSEQYSFQNNYLKIIDPELGLNYKKNCVCEVKNQLYPNGAIKSNVHIHKGKLHGPAAFYAENGQVLAQNWYIDGHLDGKGWFYYSSGELYAIKRYRKGHLDGRQEYYYKNGLPKSVLYYKEGLIDNEVVLFHENGKLKREMHFKEGKRDGIERMWNEEGMLLIEAEYKENTPVGKAREWYPNGNLAKEVIYEEESENFEIRQWKESGELVSADDTRGKDYFDLVSRYSKSLNTSLQNIYKTLVNIAPTLPEKKHGDESTTIEEDLLVLRQEMDKLNKFNQTLLTMGGYEGKNPKEAVWKTPEAEKLLRAQLAGISEKLSEMANITQVNLKDLFDKMEQLRKQDEHDDKNKT